MNIILHFIFCFFAVFFYSLIMKAPGRSVPFTALTAAIGYALYEVIYVCFSQELVGYFAGTLFISVSAEILARIMKMPSIMFVFPAVIPLVPGIGLYKTMMTLVENRLDDFLGEGVKTLFIAGIMAVAIAVSDLAARQIKKTT